MVDESHEKKDEHNITDDNQFRNEPSNAWVWIILFLLALIIIFFLFGGGRLFGAT